MNNDSKSTQEPDVLIIIVNYNLTECIKELLDSIKKNTVNVNYQTVVVDNNSPDRSIEVLQSEFPEVNFLFLETNFGFGHANNCAMKKFSAKYYLLLNPDTVVPSNIAKRMCDVMAQDNKLGILGLFQIKPSGEKIIPCTLFPGLLEEFFELLHLSKQFATSLFKSKMSLSKNSILFVDFVYGACMMIRKEVIEITGGFDEDYFLFTEETDLCYRAKTHNYKIAYLKDTFIIHHSGKITNKNKAERVLRTNESKLLFFNKNYSNTKIFFIRILKIMSFIKMIFLKKITGHSEKEVIKNYWTLIKQYAKNSPVKNYKKEFNRL